MSKNDLKKKIICPWCERGAIIGLEDAKGIISVVCPKCGKCFKANLDTGQGARASPIKIKAAK